MVAISVTAANVVAATNAVVLDVILGTTITAGMSVYMDTSTGKYIGCDADVAASAVCAGIALNGGADTQPCRIQTSGDIDLGATLTVGEIYMVGLAAGAIAPEADIQTGDFPTVLGVASSASNLKMGIVVGGTAIP